MLSNSQKASKHQAIEEKMMGQASSTSKTQGEPVIVAKQLTKCYETYHKPIHRLWQSLNPKKKYHDDFWALKGIDLTVYKGETIGIVGKNGSGKSTLLQIITGILQPTSGSLHTQGRIAALLELGAGFNPEFTGMENARLNASIMGLTREEFHQKLPDIVEFSGLGDFLNRPVKTYSSGMFVRLAFAVVINMNPDILIIDEALAVGDVRFQRKCFRRLQKIKEEGTSILFVTHSTDSVLRFCDRAIMLDDGELQMTDSPKEVVQAYLEMMFSSDTTHTKVSRLDNNQNGYDANNDYCVEQASYNSNEHRWGDGRAKIYRYELLRNGDDCGGIVQRDDDITLRMSVVFHDDLDDLIYGITVKTNDGNIIYSTNSRLIGTLPTQQKQGDLIEIQYQFKVNLLGGDYFISLGVAQDHESKDNIAIDRRYDMIHLHVGETKDAHGIVSLKGSLSMLDSKLEGNELT